MIHYFKQALTDRIAWGILILYGIWNNCFDYNAFIHSNLYLEVKQVVVVLICICMLPYILKHTGQALSRYVRILLLLYVCSIFSSFVFWEQSIYQGIRGITKSFMLLIIFYILELKKIQIFSIVNGILLISITYAILLIIGVITFPHNMFGDVDRAVADIENRGFFRLAIPGSDFIVLSIFWALTNYKKINNKIIWLLVFFILLIMRGTRTPILGCCLVCFVWLLHKYKNKWYLYLFVVVFCLSVPTFLGVASSSNTDNIIIKAVQLTQKQLDNNSEDEDIRISMSNYYLFDFNDGNIGKIIFGNGVPGFNGPYTNEVQMLSEYEHFYSCDVGFVQIFTYFGLVGILVYLLLLIQIIRTPVSKDALFAKMMMFFYYLILPTNNMLISNIIVVAISLYVIHLGNLTLSSQQDT